jgi:hypothetical protein
MASKDIEVVLFKNSMFKYYHPKDKKKNKIGYYYVYDEKGVITEFVYEKKIKPGKIEYTNYFGYEFWNGEFYSYTKLLFEILYSRRCFVKYTADINNRFKSGFFTGGFITD